MGFTSTFASQDSGVELPAWFKEKYNDYLHINYGYICSKGGIKIYAHKIFEDYQKALIESGYFCEHIREMEVAVIAENGVVTKVLITKDDIKYNVYYNEYYEDEAVYWQ
jgi:hypothetical protein